MSNKILITGASGFIGSRLVERLVLESDADVRCLVRRPMSAARIARMPVEIIQGDLTDLDAARRAVDGCSTVYHLAFDFGDLLSNVGALTNLARAAKDAGVRQLLHASTISVFEPLPAGDVDENSPKELVGDPYGDAKIMVEREALRLYRDEGCPIAIVQPTIVYGPYSGAWTDTPIQQLLSGKVVLPAGGQGIANAVYVDDVVDGMILAATKSEAVGETFLISGPDWPTWQDFYGAYAEELGVEAIEFMSDEAVEKISKGVVSNIKLTIGDPKRIFRIKAIKSLGMAVKPHLNNQAKQLIKDVYGLYRHFAPAPVFVPDPIRLQLLATKGKIQSEKARRVLGYESKFDIKRGMEATRAYIRWAYLTGKAA